MIGVAQIYIYHSFQPRIWLSKPVPPEGDWNWKRPENVADSSGEDAVISARLAVIDSWIQVILEFLTEHEICQPKCGRMMETVFEAYI